MPKTSTKDFFPGNMVSLGKCWTLLLKSCLSNEILVDDFIAPDGANLSLLLPLVAQLRLILFQCTDTEEFWFGRFSVFSLSTYS